jgi:hypothetical protein
MTSSISQRIATSFLAVFFILGCAGTPPMPYPGTPAGRAVEAPQPILSPLPSFR